MIVHLALLAVGLAVGAYCLTGGADYGAGLWELLARGPGAKSERRALANAIAPIWEVHHVWVLFAVILLLTCFPGGAAAIADRAHLPLGLALFGIVIRGSAFAFRAYGKGTEAFNARWGLAYGVSSVVTPVFLGAAVGTISSETSGDWSAAFPLAVGFLALSLFAYLAAVYMTCICEEGLLSLFRRRACIASGVAALLAVLTWWLARGAAPVAYHGLLDDSWSRALVTATVVAAAGAFGALLLGRFRVARALAALQVLGILGAWALALNGRLVAPDVFYSEVAAPEPVIRAALLASVIGLTILIPSLWLLVRVTSDRSRREIGD